MHRKIHIHYMLRPITYACFNDQMTQLIKTLINMHQLWNVIWVEDECEVLQVLGASVQESNMAVGHNTVVEDQSRQLKVIVTLVFLVFVCITYS